MWLNLELIVIFLCVVELFVVQHYVIFLGLVIICAWDYVNILMQDHYFFSCLSVLAILLNLLCGCEL